MSVDFGGTSVLFYRREIEGNFVRDAKTQFG